MGFSNLENITTEVKKRGRKPKLQLMKVDTASLATSKVEVTELQSNKTGANLSDIEWIGKWVCFMKNGLPIIGRVLYTKKDILNKIELYTSAGMTNAEYVLEFR